MSAKVHLAQSTVFSITSGSSLILTTLVRPQARASGNSSGRTGRGSRVVKQARERNCLC